MKMIKLFASAMAFMICCTSINAQQKAQDHLGIPGPIQFDNASWQLANSAHPLPNFYTQQYVRAGDELDAYKKMLMINYLIDTMDLKHFVSLKVDQIQKLKENNSLVQYQVYNYNQDIVLDFLFTASNPDGQSVGVVERNVYRYTPMKDKSGKAAIRVFAFSERAYGASAIYKLMDNIKSNTPESIRIVSTFNVPAITVK
jgi:hypothetical protein